LLGLALPGDGLDPGEHLLDAMACPLAMPVAAKTKKSLPRDTRIALHLGFALHELEDVSPISLNYTI